LKPRRRHTAGTDGERLRRSLSMRSVCTVLVAASAWLGGSAAAAALLSSRALVVTKGKAVKQVAVAGKHIVWETGPLEGENSGTALLERKLGTARKRVLVRSVKSSYGLALASGWVVYADGGVRTRLSAIRPDGSRKMVLSRWLAAPFAARGRLLAWIEQDGRRQKVVVRDMSTGRVRLVSMPPRCEHGHCYQIEQVMLADRGVVFTRDSTNPDLSWVVRIRFSNRVKTSVQIRHDPQPNLVPSSAGAVYYAFGRGWHRWDFGGQPRGAPFRANPPAPLLGYEHGRWFLATRRGCDYGVVVLDRSGHRRVVASPRRLRALVPSRSRLCVLLQAFSSVGRQPVTAWALVPRASSEEHSDKGLFGVAFSGAQP
jgi:hypothetical protein